jgi:hypothetical protein
MRNNIIHIQEKPAIIEAAEEHDRKECIALDKKVDGANRELAQWLRDHPIYTAPEVAKWLNCGETRIKNLRSWANKAFEGKPFRPGNQRARADEALKTNDNFDDDTFEPSDEVEDPHHVLMNVLDSIKDSKAVAEAYRKIFKVSSFDREAKAEIYNAINQLIVKWRTVQSTLNRKGQG